METRRIYTYAFIYYNLFPVPKGVGGLYFFSSYRPVLTSSLSHAAASRHL